jgi:hypothetical protein
MRKSARLSPWELIAGGNGDRTQKELIAKLMRASNGHRRINGHTKGPIDKIRLGSRNLRTCSLNAPMVERLFGRSGDQGRRKRRGIHIMQTIGNETEQLIKRIERRPGPPSSNA